MTAANGRFGFLDRVQQAPGMSEQVPPVLRQGKAAGGPMDQPGAEMLFERHDLARDGRLRHAEFARDGGERARFGHTHKNAKCGKKVQRLCLQHMEPMVCGAV